MSIVPTVAAFGLGWVRAVRALSGAMAWSIEPAIRAGAAHGLGVTPVIASVAQRQLESWVIHLGSVEGVADDYPPAEGQFLVVFLGGVDDK